jgi:hypothetical protein
MAPRRSRCRRPPTEFTHVSIPGSRMCCEQTTSECSVNRHVFFLRIMKFPRLLEPITLRGGAVLRNRALMGSMHTGASHTARSSGQAQAPPAVMPVRDSGTAPGRASRTLTQPSVCSPPRPSSQHLAPAAQAWRRARAGVTPSTRWAPSLPSAPEVRQVDHGRGTQSTDRRYSLQTPTHRPAPFLPPGGIGLMVTGGIAPNSAGRVAPFAASMTSPSDARRHRTVSRAGFG